MAWQDQCMEALMNANLFLSAPHMERFDETWEMLKQQPFCTKGMCKTLFVSAWDQEHFQTFKDSFDEMVRKGDTDTSYMLEKWREMLKNAVLSERELCKMTIEFLEKEGETPDEHYLIKLSHHWVPIADNALEMGRLLDSME